MRTTLKCTGTSVINFTENVTKFVLNDIYLNVLHEPLGVVAKPTGYDELCALYDKVTVRAAKVTLRFTNINSYIWYVDSMLLDEDQPSITANWSYDWNERPGVKRTLIKAATSSGGAAAETRSVHTRYAKISRIKKAKLDENDTIELGQSDDPTHKYFLRYWVGYPTDLTKGYTVALNLERTIKWYLEFTQKKSTLWDHSY